MVQHDNKQAYCALSRQCNTAYAENFLYKPEVEFEIFKYKPDLTFAFEEKQNGITGTDDV
jgi:hypothetical protein